MPKSVYERRIARVLGSTAIASVADTPKDHAGPSASRSPSPSQGASETPLPRFTPPSSPSGADSMASDPEPSFQEKLRRVFLKHNLTHSAIKDIVAVVREVADLPRDPRTIMRTKNIAQELEIDGLRIIMIMIQKLEPSMRRRCSGNTQSCSRVSS